MRIEYLYRYPVKGLTAEALDQAEVETGGAIPWDRAFALAQGDSGFDPAHPVWLPKYNFMCLMKNARASRLFSTFDPGSRRLRIRAPDGSEIEANVMTPEGRARVAAFLVAYLGEEARVEPSFHYIPGHVFGDQRRPVVSLQNLASLRDFEAKVGARRHRRRFRANIWFSGAPAWAERDWIGREIQVGGAVLRVLKGITRCPATQVNPETGERDADPAAELQSLYGHIELGVHAEVIDGGRFAVGDAMELLEP
ncbi:MOSC domain-containing protein [Rhodopila globiformis]|uniref:MOSC domain-containing protein n=1 Tax=Rhodopila globiformis TaxID=1071 RepID=A0A2S6MUA9_RHOGL|nr:MOSC N-terminal beta barrel domain-containing protein [Rhodopila globiformis]PPQ25947.1 MOSC domain-containing protein [Rhodopila globiformis]